MKLILEKELEHRIKHILAPFQSPEAWASLGLDFSPVANAAVLLKGKPGTGKSTLAHYMSRRLGYSKRRPMPTITFADVSSAHLGDTEKKIVAAFATDAQAIFLDEVDALAWDRNKVNEDTMHMLGIVNTLLTQTDAFLARGGLLILATNFDAIIDPALLSRMTDTIHLAPPTGEMAMRLWRSKLPKPPHADTLTTSQIMQLIDLHKEPLTPRAIQHIILSACRRAFAEDRPVVFEDYFH